MTAIKVGAGMEKEVGIWVTSKELSTGFVDLVREEEGSKRTAQTFYSVFGRLERPKCRGDAAGRSRLILKGIWWRRLFRDRWSCSMHPGFVSKRKIRLKEDLESPIWCFLKWAFQGERDSLYSGIPAPAYLSHWNVWWWNQRSRLEGSLRFAVRERGPSDSFLDSSCKRKALSESLYSRWIASQVFCWACCRMIRCAAYFLCNAKSKPSTK